MIGTVNYLTNAANDEQKPDEPQSALWLVFRALLDHPEAFRAVEQALLTQGGAK